MKYLFWYIIFLLIFLRFITTQPNFKTGDVLKIKGHVLSEPTKSYGNLYFKLDTIFIETKTNQEIHYGDFLSLKGIFKNNKLTETHIEEVKTGNYFFSILRKHLINFYKNSLPEPSASLISGITIGAKSELPQNFKERLNAKGLSHIVVASGTNITIVGSFIVALFITRISRKYTLLLTIGFIWIYTLITGFEAPIIRASIMATVAFTGIIFGKIVNTLKVTLLAGSIMLIVYPNWLTDVGFLLSFATTISLILYQQKINLLLKRLPIIIKEDLATSLAAQIGSIPIIYFFFGQFNILSPLFNVLVLWTIPIIMFFGGLSGVISFVSPNIARFLLLPIVPVLAYFISIVNL